MGPKGPNRPPSKGGIKLYVYEPLPRRDHRCARLLQLEGGTAVHLGVVQGEGGEPPTHRRGRELSKLELVNPQGKIEMNEKLNMKLISLLNMENEIKTLNNTRKKDKKDQIQNTPRSIRFNNE